jgi:signal transduction histidine kinase
MRADAEAANRAEHELLATLSHELRTPLSAGRRSV